MSKQNELTEAIKKRVVEIGKIEIIQVTDFDPEEENGQKIMYKIHINDKYVNESYRHDYQQSLKMFEYLIKNKGVLSSEKTILTKTFNLK